MIDKIIAAFFAFVTFILSAFYTPTPVTPVNPENVPEAKLEQAVTVMTYNIYMGGTGEKAPENRAPLIKQNVEKSTLIPSECRRLPKAGMRCSRRPSPITAGSVSAEQRTSAARQVPFSIKGQV